MVNVSRNVMLLSLLSLHSLKIHYSLVILEIGDLCPCGYKDCHVQWTVLSHFENAMLATSLCLLTFNPLKVITSSEKKRKNKLCIEVQRR